jgi:hypothetical protein
MGGILSELCNDANRGERAKMKPVLSMITYPCQRRYTGQIDLDDTSKTFPAANRECER